MKWSKNKLEALKASTYRKGTLDNENDLFTSAELEEFEQLPFEFMNYHSRYSELNEQDFLPYYGDPSYEYYKGGMVGDSVYDEYEQPDIESYDKEPIPLSAKTEEYYRKILELGQEKGIPVVTVIAPFYILNQEYRIFLAAEQIAKEYGQMFVNYNELYDAIGLDFSTDILDAGSHLNRCGAEKFTHKLGQMLQDNFDLTDHRGDSRYQSWEDGAQRYTRAYGTMNGLTEIESGADYVNHLLAEGQYSFAVILNGTDEGVSDEAAAQINAVFEAMDIPNETICDGIWFFENGKLQWSNTDREGFKKAHRFDRYHDVRFEYGITAEDDESAGFFIRNDTDSVIACENLLTIHAYDNFSCIHADTYRCDADGVRK